MFPTCNAPRRGTAPLPASAPNLGPMRADPRAWRASGFRSATVSSREESRPTPVRACHHEYHGPKEREPHVEHHPPSTTPHRMQPPPSHDAGLPHGVRAEQDDGDDVRPKHEEAGGDSVSHTSQRYASGPSRARTTWNSPDAPLPIDDDHRPRASRPPTGKPESLRGTTS